MLERLRLNLILTYRRSDKHIGFYGSHNARHGESYVRFGVCKSEESLALAENRLRQLKPIIG